MNRLTKVTIKNFKSLRDTTVELGALNVLVGANGSGKSNFLEALEFVRDMVIFASGRLNTVNLTTKYGHLYNLHDHSYFSIGLELLIDEIIYEYQFSIMREKVDDFSERDVVDAEVYKTNSVVIFERNRTDWIREPEGVKILVQKDSLSLPLISALEIIRPFYDFLEQMFFYHMTPANISTPSLMPDERLTEYGSNFASYLHRFRQQNEHYPDFESSFKSLIGHVQKIETTDVLVFKEVHIITNDNLDLELNQESTGTVVSIGRLLSFYQQPTPSFIALEEPENDIHPRALAALCDVIRETATRSQVIITTHSPDMISRFDINDLRIVERTEDGTKIGWLESAQREAVEKMLATTSDLLFIQGELRREKMPS